MNFIRWISFHYKNKFSKYGTSLEKFQWSIRKQHVYNKDDRNIKQLINDMATLPIVGARK